MALLPDLRTVLTDLTPLFALARRGVAEVVITGVTYYKPEGKPSVGSDPSVVLVARSLLKPWQFLAFDAAGPEDFWALGLASHSGQPHHMEALAKLAQVAQAGEEELVCPRCFPLDPQIASMMQSAAVQPSRLHHPCAGKHLVALAACTRYGWPHANYWDTEHPAQKKVQALIGSIVGEKPLWMTDSCGLPTIAISARAHLNLWERLATGDDLKVRQLRRLWTDNIRLVGGNGRLESDLMDVAKGQLLAKEGADGLLAVVALPDEGQPAATCLIKLASGYSQTYLALALWGVLSRQPAGSLPKAFQTVADYLRSRLEKWVPRDQELVLPPFDERASGSRQ